MCYYMIRLVLRFASLIFSVSSSCPYKLVHKKLLVLLHTLADKTIDDVEVVEEWEDEEEVEAKVYVSAISSPLSDS